jgi:bifunctional non-homologous end joining protein LigD
MAGARNAALRPKGTARRRSAASKDVAPRTERGPASPIAAARPVVITHPEKVLFPDDGITKGELAAYYDLVADVMLPHLRNRPITMERFPSGIGAKGFLQKDVVKGFPAWLTRVEAPKKDGTVHYAIANDRRSVQWLANQNTITMHVWPSRAPRISRPDICVFDLDPSRDEPEVLRTAALALRDLLLEHDVSSWVKTSGSKGFHIVTRLKRDATFGASATFAHTVAAILVERLPKHLTLEFSKADRGGRILIDIGRNRQGATFAAAYTVRPRTGAPVSAPCTWDEVERGTVHPGTFTLRNMAARLDAVGDLWADLIARP